MQIAVLVDNSQAARNYIRDIRVGVEGFVTEMLNGDEARDLDHRAGRAADDSRRYLLRSREGHQGRQPDLRAAPAAACYLLDGIIEISQGFKKREAQRPVIVAITTEGPEFSSRR